MKSLAAAAGIRQASLIIAMACAAAMCPMTAMAQGTADGPGVMRARTAAEASPYYGEVSEMASDLTANMPDRERQCCYDTMMAGVFGGNYHGKAAPDGNGDLMCSLAMDSRDMLIHVIGELYGQTKAFRDSLGMFYIYSDGRISLNGDGINEQNYNALKTVYQAAEGLKIQTEGMDAASRAKAVHDYIAGMYVYGTRTDRNEEGALWMAANGRGVCAAYATMFLILGRYCGLDAGAVLYYTQPDVMHMYDTVTLENGEVRCVDVTWDDITGSYAYFLETQEQNAISHPRLDEGPSGQA